MNAHTQGRLSPFQVDLATIFFGLPESAGFLLAGGAALIAQGLIQRETDDLDFFAHRGVDVAAAGDALTAACTSQGWAVLIIRRGAEFRRLEVTRPGAEPSEPQETLYVDLALDSPPVSAPTLTIVGPALAPKELAVRKVLALFGRAEPRDFTDVHSLNQEFDRNELLQIAAEEDAGFDIGVFIQMLRSHRRLRDDDFPRSTARVKDVRAYFDEWADELDS